MLTAIALVALGLFIGVVVGFFVCALCVVSTYPMPDQGDES